MSMPPRSASRYHQGAMDLPISITSAVAATRRQDFIAQADVDRMGPRPARRDIRSRSLSAFALCRAGMTTLSLGRLATRRV
jgi:hypothetical protein